MEVAVQHAVAEEEVVLQPEVEELGHFGGGVVIAEQEVEFFVLEGVEVVAVDAGLEVVLDLPDDCFYLVFHEGAAAVEGQAGLYFEERFHPVVGAAEDGGVVSGEDQGGICAGFPFEDAAVDEEEHLVLADGDVLVGAEAEGEFPGEDEEEMGFGLVAQFHGLAGFQGDIPGDNPGLGEVIGAYALGRV